MCNRRIYLTDVIAGLRAKGERVAASKVGDATLMLGVNSQDGAGRGRAAHDVAWGRQGVGRRPPVGASRYGQTVRNSGTVLRWRLFTRRSWAWHSRSRGVARG